MLRRIGTSVLVITALHFAPSATADPSAQSGTFVSSMNTVELMRACDTQNKLNLECSGYIIGVYDVLSITGAICPQRNPQGGTYQAISVALKFLKEHPESWHMHPADLLTESFKAAFPCAKQQ